MTKVVPSMKLSYKPRSRGAAQSIRVLLSASAKAVVGAALFLSGFGFGAASLALAQDIGSVIALPDAPFVVPVPDRDYHFPSYNSLDVLTQRNDNNRSGASHWPGVNQHSVSRLSGFSQARRVLRGRRSDRAATLCPLGDGAGHPPACADHRDVEQ